MITLKDLAKKLEEKGLEHKVNNNSIRVTSHKDGITISSCLTISNDSNIFIRCGIVLGQDEPTINFYKYLNDKNLKTALKYLVFKSSQDNWVLDCSVPLFDCSNLDDCLEHVRLINEIMAEEFEDIKKNYCL